VLELTVAPTGGNETPSVVQQHAKDFTDLHGRSIAVDGPRPRLRAKAACGISDAQRMKGTSPSRASGVEAARHRSAKMVLQQSINELERGSPWPLSGSAST
jgi:hypothetical protein